MLLVEFHRFFAGRSQPYDETVRPQGQVQHRPHFLIVFHDEYDGLLVVGGSLNLGEQNVAIKRLLNVSNTAQAVSRVSPLVHKGHYDHPNASQGGVSLLFLLEVDSA